MATPTAMIAISSADMVARIRPPAGLGAQDVDQPLPVSCFGFDDSMQTRPEQGRPSARTSAAKAGIRRIGPASEGAGRVAAIPHERAAARTERPGVPQALRHLRPGPHRGRRCGYRGIAALLRPATDFAGAFLVTRERLEGWLGPRRNAPSYDELVPLKRQYGGSAGTLLVGLVRYGVIDDQTLSW